VKRAVALRAGYACSFTGCPQLTAGPSDESEMAVTMIGKAAHIHAAARGGRRYLESMTPQERAGISNAIWLCANHADLIDRDEARFTADELRRMKREHEAKCAERQRNALHTGQAAPDFVAVGPGIIFTSEFVGADQSEGAFELHHFFEGDFHTLLRYVGGFTEAAPMDRYVLANFIGDGRVLSSAPSVTKGTSGRYVIRCPVAPGPGRIRAEELGADFAISENHDLVAEDGNIALVSGLDALPQRIKTCLSHQKGESPFHPDSGTRLAEYYRLLRGSPWLENYMRLEVIRQAAIPYIDTLTRQQYTPLQCVERVYGIRVLANAPSANWLPIRVDLEVKGVGRWQHELSFFVTETPAARQSFEEILSGSSHPQN
jgi:hypothetical protein